MGRSVLEFRLTYEGALKGASNGNKRAPHKHEIRRVFNRQLRTLWETEPYLRTARKADRYANPHPQPKLVDYLRGANSRFGYEFVPLVTEELRLYCSVEILFLRPEAPGRALNSGDLDNRLKTLFDALRMPATKEELAGNNAPKGDESPFYCLLSDDKLITKVSVETDRLLEPTGAVDQANDCRLVITVRLKPYDMGWDNLNFS